MTTLLGSFGSPGGTAINGSLHLKLTGNASLASGACGGPKVIAPWEEAVFTLVNGAITGPGAGPYTVYGLDCLAPSGLQYIMSILNIDKGLIYGPIRTSAITGSSVDLGTISPSAPGGIVGALGGDVTGPPAGNTVVRLQNRALASTAPETGALMKWDGTQWEPSTLAKDTDAWLLVGPGMTAAFDPGASLGEAGNTKRLYLTNDAANCVNQQTVSDGPVTAQSQLQSAFGSAVHYANATDVYAAMQNTGGTLSDILSILATTRTLRGLSLIIKDSGGTTTASVTAGGTIRGQVVGGIYFEGRGDQFGGTSGITYDDLSITIEVMSLAAAAGPYTFAGFVAPVTGSSRRITIFNLSGQNVTFQHAAGTSAAANRFSMVSAANFVMANNTAVVATYDQINARWRIGVLDWR